MLVYNKAWPWRWNAAAGLATGLSGRAPQQREGGLRVAAAGAAVQGVCVLILGYAVKESSENEEYHRESAKMSASPRPRCGAGVIGVLRRGGHRRVRDARVGENALCTGVLAASRLIGPLICGFGGASEEESVGAALYRTTPYACVVAVAATPELALTNKCRTSST